MKTILSLLIVIAAGLAGLAFVFTDVLVLPPGIGRISLAGVFFILVGYVLAKMNAGRRPRVWAMASGWGLEILGVIGLWISITQPASGDLGLALLFLLGPGIAALLGGTVALRGGPAAA
jgi:hypothetical protein